MLFILITQQLPQTIAREIYEYSKKNGFGFLDAPVSGGQAGAENGALNSYDWWRSKSGALIKQKIK